MKFLSLLLSPLQSLSLPAQTPELSGWQAEIYALLTQQQNHWNRGDIHAFMEGYWKSDDLRLVSAEGISRGWQATLDRYLAVYAHAPAMGHLRLDTLEYTLLTPDRALVTGHWLLQRNFDAPEGYFSLILGKIEGRWAIICDHTSKSVGAG